MCCAKQVALHYNQQQYNITTIIYRLSVNLSICIRYNILMLTSFIQTDTVHSEIFARVLFSRNFAVS